MNYNSQTMEVIQQRRNAAYEKLEHKKDELIKKIPEIKSLIDKINFVERSYDISIRKDLDNLYQQLYKLLEKNSYPQNYLEPEYTCNICKDTGIVYKDNNRQYCSCFLNLRNDLKKEFYKKSIDTSQCFDNFNLNLFDEVVIKANPGSNESETIKQRLGMKILRDEAIAYCDKFPNNPIKNMLFIGGSGLGKTYMLNCIANSIIDKGFSLVYLNSSQWLKISKDYIFNQDNQNYQNMLDCDLLIIDDLGCEMMMENINVNSLYEIIEYKLANNKSFIFSTNLSLSNLQQRYGERILSRLQHQKYVRTMQFKGKDIRFYDR